MAKPLNFDCPRCNRSYELNIDLEVAKSKRQRAKCARCGERFEIASRVAAQQTSEDPDGAELRTSHSRTVADTRISGRLAAALLASGGETRQAELVANPRDSKADTSAQRGLKEPELPTVHFTSPSKGDQQPAQELSIPAPLPSEPVQEEEEEEEAVLPEPLDWLARAGTGPEILHRELSDREGKLASLISS